MLLENKHFRYIKFLGLPIYWAFLTYMLLKPGQEMAGAWWVFPGLDKVVHLLIFAVLGGLYRLSFPRQSAYLFFGVMLVYGIGTELLQGYMKLGRSMELLDILADLLGAYLGFTAGKMIERRLFRREY